MRRVKIAAITCLALVVGILAAGALLWLLAGGTVIVEAQGPDGTDTYYVAPDGDCGGMAPCYSTVQAAVDAADDPGDVIKVAAGTYTDVQGRPAPGGYDGPSVITQVVHISKTVIVQGGYTTTNWTVSDPEANPTVLDALGQGRVMFIAGDISPTVEGLCIAGGDAAELGGYTDYWGNTYNAGGGVYLVDSAATLNGNTITANSSENTRGGGMYLYHSAATLNSNVVVTNTTSWGAMGWGAGGGLYLKASPATLMGNTISANTVDGSGGGVYLEASPATLTGNTISDNFNPYGCGGVYMDASAATLSGNTITDNRAIGDGGGVCLYWSPATLSGNTISSNSATTGGGVYLLLSDATLSGNTISSNSADTGGGGGLALCQSTATLTSNVIMSNTTMAGNGGGVALEASPATLTGNTITANTANMGLGGGVVGDGTLDGNIISRNTARNGGGVSSGGALSGNLISGNTANEIGGGVHIDGNATLINNIIVDNRANIAGSGLAIVSLSSRLLHTTVAHNTGGDGTGIYVAESWRGPSAVTLTNTILVSHTVGITVTSGNTATLEATLWGGDAWANGKDWGGTGTLITGSVNVWGDPVFVAGDYRLGLGSAAVDAGIDAGVTADIDGQARPHYAGPDLGADEWWPLVMVKAAAPDTAEPGDVVTYTLALTNMTDAAMTVRITDTLPAQVGYLGPLVYSNGAGGHVSGVITWSGTVFTAAPTLIIWPVQIAPDMPGGRIVNIAQTSDPFGVLWTDPSTISVPPGPVYLPLVLRQYP